MPSQPEFIYKYLSGYAIKRLLSNKPLLPNWYLGLESKGADYIYDVAYDTSEIFTIAKKVMVGMRLNSPNEIGVGGLSPTSAKGLLDMAEFYKKHEGGNIQNGKVYRVRYYPAYDLGEQTEDFKTWYRRVMQREPKDLAEKVEWYVQYGGKRE